MKDKKTFKSKWEEKDETCFMCNQVTKRNRGLTRQNMKNFLKKPTLQDLIIFIMLLLTLFGAWTYTQEIGQYKDMVRDPQELCLFYWENLRHGNFEGREAPGDIYTIDLENYPSSPLQ